MLFLMYIDHHSKFLLIENDSFSIWPLLYQDKKYITDPLYKKNGIEGIKKMILVEDFGTDTAVKTNIFQVLNLFKGYFL